MKTIDSIEEIEALYGLPGDTSTRKVMAAITPGYRIWIERAKFCVLTTVGPEGTDGSPRGDDGPVVRILNDTTLTMPDWRGNNRGDSLKNIVRDGRVSLMLMVPGATNVVRINGEAVLTADDDMRALFDQGGHHPRTVILIRIQEIYFQCARALIRAGLWNGVDQSDGLPSAGALLAEATEGAIGGADYDAEWPERAAKSMW